MVNKSYVMVGGVSVVVCCHNSEVRISATLNSIIAQQAKGFPWEIIVVDNASVDRTTQIAAEMLESAVGDFNAYSVVQESSLGLSYARARGIAVSRFEYILFCDDDNWLCEDYVRLAYQIMNSNSAIGALGGHGILDNTPRWLMGFEEFYAVGPQGTTHDVTTTRGCLYGAGLVVRKKVLDLLTAELGFQSLLEDRKGTSLTSGGDTELTFAIRMAGFRLFYDSRLVFRHAIPQGRLTRAYFRRLVFYVGYSWMALYPYQEKLGGYKLRYPVPNWIDVTHLIRQLIISLARTLKGLITFRPNHFRQGTVRTLFITGQVFYALKNRNYYKQVPDFIKKVSK